MKASGPFFFFLRIHKEFKFFIVTSVVICFIDSAPYNPPIPHNFRVPIFVLTVVLVPSSTTLIDMG